MARSLLTLFILSFLLSLPLKATTFMRVSIETQLQEADSIFIGHFLSQESIRVEDGSIATQMTFKLSKELGLDSELFGLEEILVHYPGGSLEGETVHIEGVPQFTAGEKVALLARNIDNRLWGLNLALGSYRIVNYGNETLLVNGVFPQDPLVSQIKISDFEHQVKKIKGSSLKVVKSIDPSSLQKNQGKNRSIASVAAPEENDLVATARPSHFWLLVFLALAGAFARYRMRNRN